jgi:small-conductance mechanosensitive channel
MFNQIASYFQNPENWQDYALSLGITAAAILSGFLLYHLLFQLITRIFGQKTGDVGNLVVEQCRAPSRFLVPLLMLRFFLPLVGIGPDLLSFVDRALGVLIIVGIAWLLIRLAYVFEGLILQHFDTTVSDNLKARRMHTQIVILRRIGIALVVVFSFASILMTFSKVRQLGTSILASAGILGIIFGFAAQRTIATLFAGIQVALTQPIRLDDVVIVENEWGRIEEITLTYVVVRIWDLRRLVLPVNYFLEKPFQNWTRVSASLLGTVYVYVDYTVPVQRVREALRRILDNAEHWDGKVGVLQVTNVSERTLELRALMSAQDSSSAWELRCHVREELVKFIQEKYPKALPLLRTELRSTA